MKWKDRKARTRLRLDRKRERRRSMVRNGHAVASRQYEQHLGSGQQFEAIADGLAELADAGKRGAVVAIAAADALGAASSEFLRALAGAVDNAVTGIRGAISDATQD